MLYLKNSLLLSILEKGQAEHFMDLARERGVCGGTIIPARGTATNAILRALGLGDKGKEIVLTVVDDKTAESVVSAAIEDSGISGVSALISNQGDNQMNSEHKLITVIVNSGYADDVMDTARKAGATGGTITHARGTAPKGQEEKFLNMTIVPEKDMVMILCNDEKQCNLIVCAIEGMDCLKEKGSGIIYVQDVSRFDNLGSK